MATFEINVKIDTKALERAIRKMPDKAVIAAQNTVNRAANKINTAVTRAITKKYNISKGKIGKAVHIVRATRSDVEAKIIVRGKQPSLIDFGGKQPARRGVSRLAKYGHTKYARLIKSGRLKKLKPRPPASYKLLRGKPKRTIPGAFIAELGAKAGPRIYRRRQNHPAYPIRRASGGVFPLKHYKGPSIPTLFDSKRVRAIYDPIIKEWIPTEFSRRFASLIKREFR